MSMFLLESRNLARSRDKERRLVKYACEKEEGIDVNVQKEMAEEEEVEERDEEEAN